MNFSILVTWLKLEMSKMSDQDRDSWTWTWTHFQFSLLKKDVIDRLTRNYGVYLLTCFFSKTVSKLENIYFLQHRCRWFLYNIINLMSYTTSEAKPAWSKIAEVRTHYCEWVGLLNMFVNLVAPIIPYVAGFHLKSP